MAGNTTTRELRQECEAQLFILHPQIRGLTDMIKVTIEEETRKVLQLVLDTALRREIRLNDMIAELDRLEADDYPTLPVIEVPAGVLADLTEQMADFNAALTRVIAQSPAAHATIDLGSPAPKHLE
jgi:hypothetical protein